MKEIIINENSGGQRIDKFIAKFMPLLPKSMMYKGFRKNCVKLNGKHIKDGSVFVEEGDVLALYFRDEFFSPEPEFVYVKPKLDIVYEDDNILVINKSAGVAVHAGERDMGNTLVDMVQSYLFENNEYNPYSEQTFRPALCNRLDRNTGGLVIAAKNAEALRGMNERIRNREVRKFYAAIAEGYPEDNDHLEGWTSRSGKVTSVSDTEKENARRVSLDYRVTARRDGHSLLEIELHTGRTHQIRAQLSHAGYPLAGDTKYGGHGGMFRQALWSTRLIFDFKDTDFVLGYLKGKEIKVRAPFEKEFE